MAPDFRYAQFCPLARAAELLGERWTLLVVRELFTGPQRFSDLRRRLPGLSSSVLAERLAKLEDRGIARRHQLAPPAAATVYELDETGRALAPVMTELTRWGLRFLENLEPGDHYEPAWARLALTLFAVRGPAPARRFAIRIPDPHAGELHATVSGGPDGVHVTHALQPADAEIRADGLTLLALLAGRARAADLATAGAIEVTGDLASLDDFPALFELKLRETPAPASVEPADAIQEGS